MIESNIGQRIGGLALVVVGVGFTVNSWHTALNSGYYYPKAAVAFPMFAMFGLGLLLFPQDRRRAVNGADGPQKADKLPPIWFAMFVVGVLLGLVNVLAHSKQ